MVQKLTLAFALLASGVWAAAQSPPRGPTGRVAGVPQSSRASVGHVPAGGSGWADPARPVRQRLRDPSVCPLVQDRPGRQWLRNPADCPRLRGMSRMSPRWTGWSGRPREGDWWSPCPRRPQACCRGGRGHGHAWGWRR